MYQESFNLNIKYYFPVWDYRVPTIFSKTDGWIKGSYYWFNKSEDGKFISASVEPSGLLFHAVMEYDELQKWKEEIKSVSTKILGYKIGELELGEVHDFEWMDLNMKVFEEFSILWNSINYNYESGEEWKFYDLNKSGLTEVDTIEQMKILFRNKKHNLHDSLASDFQTMRNPATSKFLYEMVIQNEIPEFDYRPVSRKCVWALADIGTDESKSYLEKIYESNNEIIKDFARKRLERWDTELKRKGRYMNYDLRRGVKVKNYYDVESLLPKEGRNIIGYKVDEYIIVYQAYKQSIAKYSVENQKLGGPGFSYDRMSWIKPGFLWMMYRSGWASKENQESIIAIKIKINDFKKILNKGVLSSFDSEYYESELIWKAKISESDVRIQWDPDHDPYGDKQKRKAIQIGIKGETLREFGQKMIYEVFDITSYVKKQRIYVNHGRLDLLEIPNEQIIEI